ncbi:MBL fold metallo-hydrolase [Halosolutus halophilus]|uniref:MBL fold metallo-hydrolase n=1 Tax=Halosolutus halophilus TaxID=1552990 RepID=UPI002235157B|nr:MBL fold metallo-hydrolase [Halosolutus halophilus]
MHDHDEAGVHALPIDVEYGGRQLTITPSVVETDRGLVLIDVGPQRAVDSLEVHLQNLGYALTDVWLIVCTHHDGDHVGGLTAVLDRVDAVVATHRDEAPYVRGDREPIKGDGDRYEPVEVDIELADGVRIPTLAGPMEVVATPGHTPGHVSLSFPEDGLLIAGDALVADGAAPLEGPKPEFTADLSRATESVGRLAERDVEHTLCYHGGYVDAGSERIEEIHENLRS